MNERRNLLKDVINHWHNWKPQFYLTIQELAEWLDCDRETVEEDLNVLQQNHVLTFDRIVQALA